MHATTLTSTTLMMWKTLQYDYGLDANELFLQAGLDPAQLTNLTHRYADEKTLALWQLALHQTQDECIGLKVAKHIHPTTLHALGFGWLSSTPLLDALERLVRFYRIVTDIEKLALQQIEPYYCLKINRISPVTKFLHQDYDTFFAALFILCQDICGQHYRPAYITMQRPQPKCANEMNAFFNIPLHFSCEHNSIWFDSATITDLLPTANANLARENDQIMTRYISNLDKTDIEMQIKSRLILKLSAGSVSEHDIACALHMSTRTLQRKLGLLNKTYKDIMDETRRQLAIEYVREHKVPMTEITFLLGYSEQANFTRAFRRWTGQSPSEFRNAS